MARKTTHRRKQGNGVTGKATTPSPHKAAAVSASAGHAPPFEIAPVHPGKDAPLPIGAKGARTVIYVHGIGNKPDQSILKCQWDTALFGHPMGDRTRLAYWVNREYYPTVEDATCATPDRVKVDDDEISTHAIMAMARGRSADDQEVISNEIAALADGDAQKEVLTRISQRMLNATTDGPPAPGTYNARILPFKWFRRFVAPKLTRAFLRDVNDFLYVDERRKEMEQSLADRLAAGGGPFVVIGHSQGSLIAYDVLRQLDPKQFDVELFLTIGSPLGIDEVQDELRDWAGGKLPFPPCVRKWVNIADPNDIVAIDKDLDGEFQGGKIEDTTKRNTDPEHPHSGTGYLQMAEVRQAVLSAVGTAFGQIVAPFVVANDLVKRIENGRRDERHRVLVQLATEGRNGRQEQDLDVVADQVSAKIAEMLRQQKLDETDAKVDRLRRYVVAELTRLEVETLRSYFKELRIDGIWRNAEKRAFINASTHTVQARPANLGYGADGRRVSWAVLDTGLRADHPHFTEYKNVVAQWDCTKTGPADRLGPGGDRFDSLDGNGHGTHVAGIIAGALKVNDPRDGDALFAGMAPRCQLLGFKVLDDNGNGQDGWIIKALDKVAELNERSGRLVVHGLNLSLGGNFDPSVFGCGHTPLCQELRRLWQQGVLVCLAAGNEGFASLQAENGLIQANMDITIGDPANLDEAIAVGSVHKTNPHTYGVSYFSSRGPTADGRRKPDLVAPGERIISARHDWRDHVTGKAPPKGKGAAYERDDVYLEMSGTSMATPHVSGLLASFLSLRQEFIGYPDRVKKILLDSCIDLERDRYMQGAGLPNLIKMLALN